MYNSTFVVRFLFHFQCNVGVYSVSSQHRRLRRLPVTHKLCRGAILERKILIILSRGLQNSLNLQDEDVPANFLGDRKEGVGEGADILVEGIYFAESIGNGGEVLDRVGDRVGVVVVGDADAPQLNILRYVADGPFSGADDT